MIVRPLFHVHGLVVGLLSSLTAVVVMALLVVGRFSASTFWNDMVKYDATWYTMIPIIHQIILNWHFSNPNSNTQSPNSFGAIVHRLHLSYWIGLRKHLVLQFWRHMHWLRWSIWYCQTHYLRKASIKLDRWEGQRKQRKRIKVESSFSVLLNQIWWVFVDQMEVNGITIWCV